MIVITFIFLSLFLSLRVQVYYFWLSSTFDFNSSSFSHWLLTLTPGSCDDVFAVATVPNGECMVSKFGFRTLNRFAVRDGFALRRFVVGRFGPSAPPLMLLLPLLFTKGSGFWSFGTGAGFCSTPPRSKMFAPKFGGGGGPATLFCAPPGCCCC